MTATKTWLFAAVVAAAHLVVALTHGGPVAVPDVSAYLSVAQWAVGVGQSVEGLQYHPGYGLLLTPVALVVRTDGVALHTMALALNGLAAGGAVVVAVRLAQACLPETIGAAHTERGRSRLLLAVAALAALHPSLSTASRIAWPETLLVLLILSIALCLAKAARTASKLAAQSSRRLLSLAGLLAGLSFALHPRAAVLTLALAVVTLAVRWVRAAWNRVLGGLAVGWALAVAALTITQTWPSGQASQADTLESGLEPFALVAGQLIGLSASTLGLALLGLLFGLAAGLPRLLSAKRSSELSGPSISAATSQVLRAPAAFLAVSALAVFLLGGLFLAGSARADIWLYGRYADPWAVPLAIAGICALAASLRNSKPARNGSPGSPRQTPAAFAPTIWLAFALLAVTLMVVWLGAGEGPFTPARRIMTLSLSPLWSLAGTETVRGVAALATALALVGVALVAGTDLGKKFAVTAPAVLLAVGTLALLGTATISNHRHLADVGDVAAGQAQTSQLALEEASRSNLDCLAHDADSLPGYASWLYRLRTPQLRHESFSRLEDQPACGPLVIATDDLLQDCPGSEQLASEPRADWGLWRLPEPSACF